MREARLFLCAILLVGCGKDATGGNDIDGGLGSDAGVCPPPQLLCGTNCVDVSSSNTHCGACDTPCATSCGSGVCGGSATDCDPGYVLCGGSECRDVSGDPEQCGSCSGVCGDDEFCSDGDCGCRPQLTDCGAGCVDTQSDPAHCGGCGAPCAGVCVSGQCLDAAACTGTVCTGACVNTGSNPLHCGGCGTTCARDQICIDGDCWDYEPAVGCTSCGGCTACPSDETCCEVPGYGVSCVDTAVGCP